MSGEFGGFGRTPVRFKRNDSTYQFDGCYITANSFALFGMTPLVGRLPSEEDARPDSAPVFVISAKLWKEQFNEDPSVVGQTFSLNGVQRRLVGIMPPRFRWAWVDVWLPFGLERAGIATNPELQGQMVYTVGRLKPDVSLTQAAADLDIVAHQYAQIERRLYPEKFTVTTKRLSDQAVEGLGFGKLFYPLMAAVGLLLLIACANVANLLLTRATVRRREIAVRSALGASRARVFRQFLIESLCLAFARCLAGCLLAYVGIKALVPLIPYNAFPQEAVIELNPSVLLVALIMAVVCTVLCGLAPALQTLRRDLRSTLSGSGTGDAIGVGHARMRSALVTIEVALCVILLVGAGLMMRTFFRMQRMDLGINAKNVLFARLALPEGSRQTAQERRRAFQGFLEKLQALPGVSAVSTTLARPPAAGMVTEVHVPGKIHTERWMTALDLCSDGYLATLQVRQRRFISERDVAAERPVAVINETFARQYFEREDPIGQTIQFGSPGPDQSSFEIIGVVSDMKNRGLESPPRAQAYIPYTVRKMSQTTFMARTEVKPESLIPRLRELVWSVNPDLALIDADSLEGWLNKYTFANSRFEFIGLASFAGIGLSLVLIGIFSLLSYFVALQTHEIGIRLALGAARGTILAGIIGKGLILVGTGLLIGIAASLVATRYIAHLMQGVSVLDPWTYCGVALLIVAASGLPDAGAPRSEYRSARRHAL